MRAGFEVNPSPARLTSFPRWSSLLHLLPWLLTNKVTSELNHLSFFSSAPMKDATHGLALTLPCVERALTPTIAISPFLLTHSNELRGVWRRSSYLTEAWQQSRNLPAAILSGAEARSSRTKRSSARRVSFENCGALSVSSGLAFVPGRQHLGSPPLCSSGIKAERLREVVQCKKEGARRVPSDSFLNYVFQVLDRSQLL